MKERIAKRPTGPLIVSALGLALTGGGIEMAIALYSGSVALLGDALHNLADVSTSAVVFLGFYVSKKRPSRAYPHGYERAEDLAGLGIALVIWASAVFAGYQSHLMDGVPPEQLAAAEKALEHVPGLLPVKLRGRWMGRSLVVEVGGELTGDTSLTTANTMGQQIERLIHEAVPEVRRVFGVPTSRSLTP